jgi:hypothetical protein
MPFQQLFLLFLQILLVTILALQTRTAWGQTASTGALLGRVTDPTGKGVPQASVTAKSEDAAVSRSTVSDDEGRFVLPLLPPGIYRLEVTKQGFSNTQSEPVQVPVTESIRVSIPLKLAGITQSVEVHDAVPLQNDTIALGRVVDAPMIQALPLAARNFAQIVDLSPGVNSAGEL